ncbi:DUF1499 domain-containing protein [Rhizobium sp. KVB221]|uniref:DUF1499 domain-containing protein n=1 Tax=Rhizobium setariae TaxID=2801340 RepID=A0A937CN85_9HYPH|nr:DUF1499 domain-containing protein [Rhizobium setariae]MBL0370883.1 DUF1499 domain-containing protein [Rhizobium setariae]
MTVRYERPISRSAYFARRLALLAFAMFVLGWGLHRFGPLETPSFLAIALVAAGLAVVAFYLAIVGLAMLWRKGAKGGKAAGQALLLVILPLVPLAFAASNYVNLPPIYDISSDLADPPQWIEEVKADQSWLGERKPETAKERQAEQNAYRTISGRRYDGALDRVYTAALKVADAMGITVTEQRGGPETAPAEARVDSKKAADEAVPDAPENVPVPLPRPEYEMGQPVTVGDAFIQGVHRSLVFGFRQDVVIRMREEAETTLVDIRVASRYGQHDLGSGAAFIEKYLRALDAELLGIAGD